MRRNLTTNETTNKTSRVAKPIVLILVTLAMLATTVLVPFAAGEAAAQSGSGTTIESWAIDVHPGGSQLMVREVEMKPNRTDVHFTAVNGRDYDTRFRADTHNTYLVDDQGNTYELYKRFEVVLEAGQRANFSMAFKPVPAGTPQVTVMYCNHERDDGDNTEAFPSFVIADLDLIDGAPAPELPGTLAPGASMKHPNGAIFNVDLLEFEPEIMKIKFRAQNGADYRTTFSSGRHVSYLEDDLGNRYTMVLADDGLFLRVNSMREVSGEIGFQGRIHPDATTVRLVLNDDESMTDPKATNPKFVLGPWELLPRRDTKPAPTSSAPSTPSSSTAASTSVPSMVRGELAIDESQVHANGVTAIVEGIQFDDNGKGSLLTVMFENRRDTPAYMNGCCRSMYLLDNLGNRYESQRFDENNIVRISAGKGATVRVWFPGAIDADATSLTVVINDRGENDLHDPYTAFAEFRFGPYQLGV